jgi:endonuclease YncB( thermonuclease family)
MRVSYQILMPLLSLFIVRVDLTDLLPLKLNVHLVKIFDGDTVLVRHGSSVFKLRFAKIDSPEMGQRFISSAVDAGDYSKQCLKKILEKEKVLIVSFEKKDIFGRVLGDINNISFKLVEAGCTTLYPGAVFSSVQEKYLFVKALKKAKARRAGLWQYGGFMTPKVWRKTNKRNALRP